MNSHHVITELTSHAETIKNDSPHDLSNLEPGEQWVQGDVRVVRLPDDFSIKNHCTALREFDGQVAPGMSMGSRHTLDSLEGVEAFELARATVLDGPIIVTTMPRTLTHPEHGDCVNLPPGKYAFPGQRVYSSHQEMLRVFD